MLTELKRRGECQWRREKGHSKKPPKLKEHPKVSVLIPARRRRDRQPARPQSHDAARKIQTAEYASVISLIKRTQRLVGKLMTVSGVVAAWRSSPLASSSICAKVIFWVIWYPVVYWAFNAMAAAVSFLKGFFRSMQQPATWVSPDRGVDDETAETSH